MRLSSDVSDEEYKQLKTLADKFGVPVDALFAAAFRDLLTRLKADDPIAHRTVTQN